MLRCIQLNWPHFPTFAWGGCGGNGLALALILGSACQFRWDLIWVGFCGGFFGGQFRGVGGWESGDGVEGVRMLRILKKWGVNMLRIFSRGG